MEVVVEVVYSVEHHVVMVVHAKVSSLVARIKRSNERNKNKTKIKEDEDEDEARSGILVRP